jgi:hypothetical protein
MPARFLYASPILFASNTLASKMSAGASCGSERHLSTVDLGVGTLNV